MLFNENSRVKIPAILHLCRLGYSYLTLKNAVIDENTNIFTDLFLQSIKRINPSVTDTEVLQNLNAISLLLDNEDLGKGFYEKLTSTSGIRLIDFDDIHNNSLHVVTELTYKKDEEEFRTDITLLINGMPLCFIEVKKPNNSDGIQAEDDRNLKRFKNKKFRKFVNITQLMVFSNNMEYDSHSIKPIQGAYYATAAYTNPSLNYFREEEKFDLSNLLSEISDDDETAILKDNNLVIIKNLEEFITNKNPNSPTNRICTSLFQPKRLFFFLQYAIAYVKGEKIEKHIMRYPQLFATKAIESKLELGTKKGIIWHTQGSGKTALAYYNVKFLTNYFQAKGIVPKFYFIVDRIDLSIQASREFKSRGLIVHKVQSREEFAKDIKSTSVIHNDSGKPEITVVNIQKFENDPDVVKKNDYNVNIQRVYFLDEVHRSYNPKGSFLANLHESDIHAIKIGLTGTPLLGTDYNSKQVFGEYIHKYYYNASIADGYTLRLIREEIATSYNLILAKTLDDIKILQGDGERKIIYAHHKFVEPMLEYIVQDFEKSRIAINDSTIGGLVICDSSEQAKMMYEIFQTKYAVQEVVPEYQMAAEPSFTYQTKYKQDSKVKTAALILHDVGTKKEREEWVEEFKAGRIDFLFVFNMLLTGFDAPRLKKLYLGRIIKAHNLLQALTRVNRTYKAFRYGYVVDFADIQKEFDKTNKDYFNELQEELGNEMEHYSNLFKSKAEMETEITEIKDLLFRFNTTNAEIFEQQISQIDNKKEMQEIVKILNNAKSLYNIIRLTGNYELMEKLDFQKLNYLSGGANRRLAIINTKEALESNTETSNLLNIALEDILFAFVKVKEEEMILADQLKNTLQRTREMLGGNFDGGDPLFISLREELERLFKKKNLSEVSKEEMERNIKELNVIYNKAKELERNNQLLKAKYDNDAKYARIHKRLMEKDPLTDSESKLFEALQSLKKEADAQILQNSKMLENESFVEKMMVRLVIDQLKNKHHFNLDAIQAKKINTMIVKEYMNEFYGRVA